MGEAPVIDSSSLILLTRTAHLHLLRAVADEILVPDEVVDEIQEYGPDDPTVLALGRTDWLKVVQSPAIPVQIATLKLGPGESAALAWAMNHPGSTLILDDMAARRAAERLGLPLLGTLGVVLAAKAAGAITAARPVLEDLRRAGMYLSERALTRALSLVDE